MGRDTPIQVYLADENAAWLKEQAEATGQSCSKYCREVILDHIDCEQNDRPYRRYGVDQQIELVLNEIQDETMELLSEFQSEKGTTLERIQRLRTAYVIAIWRLIKRDYPSSQQKAALKYAGEHIGQDPSEIPDIQTMLSTLDDSAGSK